MKVIFSPSIEAVYANTSMSDSEIIAELSRIGFEAFEFWRWWNKDINEINHARQEHGLNVASFCTKMVSLVNPALRTEYIAGLKESISIAKQLDCKFLISQVGNAQQHVPQDEQRRSIIEGLKTCAPMLEAAGITLVVEPLNTLVDHPGYYLVKSDEAFEIVNEIDSPYVKVLFDIYHQQISEGNLIPNLVGNEDLIGYLHAADHPGRHELGTGEINYTNVFQAIEKAGYDGYVGLEYFPLGQPEDSLSRILKCRGGIDHARKSD